MHRQPPPPSLNCNRSRAMLGCEHPQCLSEEQRHEMLIISYRGLGIHGAELRASSAAVVVGAGMLLLGFATPALSQRTPLRDAYFGETHVHTSWSLDAWTMGNRVTDPADAYKYFKGGTIKHPLGFDIKIDTPLVFRRRDRSLRICGCDQISQRPQFADQQAAGSGAPDPQEQQSGRGSRSLPLRRQGAADRGTGQGTDASRDRAHGLANTTSNSPMRPTNPASSPPLTSASRWGSLLSSRPVSA